MTFFKYLLDKISNLKTTFEVLLLLKNVKTHIKRKETLYCKINTSSFHSE